MLLRTMFLLALLAVLGETIVHGAASLAQAALRARSLDAARTAFVSGVRAAQASIAQGVAPAPIATCAFADANGCEINVQTTIATATPSAAPAATACPSTPCTVILQGNSAVSEARATFLISTVVNSASGATLARRSGTVAFRTFATPPYAAIVGGADATIGALLDGGAADDGGAPTSLITVEYDPSDGGTNTAGNVWQPVIENPASAAPAWER
ncbi:MAG: hypothetical protein ABR949_04630 [Candidatus Aquilonibacter sp.]